MNANHVGKKKEKQTYREYIFLTEKIVSNLEEVKNIYNLQIVIENNHPQYIYLHGDGIVIVTQKEGHVLCRDYLKTMNVHACANLMDVMKEKNIPNATLTDNVIYNDSNLYFEY